MSPLLSPPQTYRKKIINPGSCHPLAATFSSEQISRKIAFYMELKSKRNELIRKINLKDEAEPTLQPTASPLVLKKFKLLGWENTTTVRVYMRETVIKIAENLFVSKYSLDVCNVKSDHDHGYVEVVLQALEMEHRAFEEYIYPGAMYFVYDGEEEKYNPGNTAASEFIITRPEDRLQPVRYWRLSQSFIAEIEKNC